MENQFDNVEELNKKDFGILVDCVQTSDSITAKTGTYLAMKLLKHFNSFQDENKMAENGNNDEIAETVG